MKDQAAEATIAAIANKATFGGSAAAVIGGLTASDVMTFTGAFVAIVGLAVNWIYKHRDDVRKSELHKAQLRDLQDDQ
ncbi:hypothetical protein CSC70_03865 [Pseudoxanthomonas kalamensis DSM 18571]|uniref:holin n=1 Tax=Pseudoxanthomonas kalamensis TaxID=289483 RepID=UPI00139148C6|nr:holin [Pseudoxanthomonas kalamensis]KAF1711072.1 hypothetical protein CSC70_03865 [Pseudoxanthomonas kalamensis DSM 18571]